MKNYIKITILFSTILFFSSCGNKPSVEVHILNGNSKAWITLGDIEKTISSNSEKTIKYTFADAESNTFITVNSKYFARDTILEEGIYIVNLSNEKTIYVKQHLYMSKSIRGSYSKFLKEQGLGGERPDDEYNIGISKIGIYNRDGLESYDDDDDFHYPIIYKVYSFGSDAPNSLKGEKMRTVLDIYSN